MKTKNLSAKAAAFAAMLLIPALLLASGKGEKYYRGSTAKSAPAHTARPATVSTSKAHVKFAEAFAKLPLSFEKNLGQTDSSVRYLAHGQGYQLFLTPQEAVLSLRHSEPVLISPVNRVAYLKALREAQLSAKVSVLRFQLEGAARSAEIDGVDTLPGKTDYFVGSDPKEWYTDVPSYGRVAYRGIYPGIDLVFYGNQRRLEYDFVVAPGADPGAIALNVEGARKLRIDSHGSLVMHAAAGDVQLEKPLVYQEVNGERREVAGNYTISDDHKITFSVSEYDATKQLVIDPVLNYSTYLGGSANGDAGYGIAVDASGDAYLAGITYSTTFPNTASAFNQSSPGANTATNGSVFVTELNPTGTAELYSTYLSGSGTNSAGLLDFASAVAIDPAPSANCLNGASAPGICIYVTGTTYSTDFPTTSSSALTAGPLGSNPLGTSFLSKINPGLSGSSSLAYSTYLGGTGGDIGQSIAVDVAANAYVVGYTDSTDFVQPTSPNGYQTSVTSGNGSAFLARIDTTKSGTASLIYSTYLGGNGTNPGVGFPGDQANGVAVDTLGNAYLTGVTSSTNFPTTTTTTANTNIGYQTTLPTGNTVAAGFVSVINTNKSGANSLFYSTYLGGGGSDQGTAIALGPSNVVYVTGSTSSATFPVFPSTAYSASTTPPITASGPGVAFVTLIDTSQNGSGSLKYSTFLGGTMGDVAHGIKADTLGNAYVIGSTSSTDFPIIKGAFKNSLGVAPGDGFVSELSPLGNGTADLLYSSYFGGVGTGGTTPDQAYAIALDSANNAYITGQTYSSASSFPVFPNNAFQTTLTGSAAAFVAKLTLEPRVAISPSILTFSGQVVGIPSSGQTVTLTNNTNGTVTFTAPSITAGAPPASATDFAATTGTCITTPALAAGASCTVNVTFTASVTTTETAILNVNDNDSSAPQRVSLSGTAAAAVVTASFTPTPPLTFGSQVIGTTSSPAQTLTVKNTGNAPLNITAAPSITGTNGTPSTDFAIVSGSGTTCTNGAIVQPNATCTIALTFSPSGTTPNPRTANLALTDNATGSPQQVGLTGTGVVNAPIATITSSPLSFSAQLVTTASTAQTVTLKDTGNAALNLTAAPAISGTNATDFAIQSGSGTTCVNGAIVQPNATCTITIVFTPSGTTNPRTATLTFTDNASPTTQTLGLSGTGQDYTVTATTPAAIAPGSTASIPVTVTGLGGYTGSVSFTCSGSIPGGNCVAPSAVNAAPAPGATATFMVTSTAFVVPPASRRTPPISPRQIVLLLVALLFLFTVPIARRLRIRLSLVGATMLLIVLAGCSGTPATATAAGPYTFSISANSGGVSHAVNVTVTVN